MFNHIRIGILGCGWLGTALGSKLVCQGGFEREREQKLKRQKNLKHMELKVIRSN